MTDRVKSSLPKRKKYLAKSSRGVRKVNPKRRAKEWARAYGSPERVAFVQSLPCIVCLRSPCDNAHIENGGAGRKASYDKIVPLCSKTWAFIGHHRFLHNTGRTTFEKFYSIDLDKAAAETQQKWLESSGETA